MNRTESGAMGKRGPYRQFALHSPVHRPNEKAGDSRPVARIRSSNARILGLRLREALEDVGVSPVGHLRHQWQVISAKAIGVVVGLPEHQAATETIRGRFPTAVKHRTPKTHATISLMTCPPV